MEEILDHCTTRDFNETWWDKPPAGARFVLKYHRYHHCSCQLSVLSSSTEAGHYLAQYLIGSTHTQKPLQPWHLPSLPTNVHWTAATIIVDAALKRNTVPGSTILGAGLGAATENMVIPSTPQICWGKNGGPRINSLCLGQEKSPDINSLCLGREKNSWPFTAVHLPGGPGSSLGTGWWEGATLMSHQHGKRGDSLWFLSQVHNYEPSPARVIQE